MLHLFRRIIKMTNGNYSLFVRPLSLEIKLEVEKYFPTMVGT